MASYPIATFNYDAISLSIDILGSPVLLPYANGIYFAYSGKGENSFISSYSTYYSVFVGALNIDGSLQWISRFPSNLQTEGDCYSPSIALGRMGEIYLAFVTNKAIPGFNNMYDNLKNGYISCGDNCVQPLGYADIVLARINPQTQSVVWATQSANLNSPNNETVPQVATDTTSNLVYISYQCSGNVGNNPALGKTNIVLSCFDHIGTKLWTVGDATINSTGTNSNPSIVTDNAGGVYLAYETTGTGPTQQVEVVKFQSVYFGTYVPNYQWKLSVVDPRLVVSSGKSFMPQVSYQKQLYVSFLTSGSLPGNTHSVSGNDIVIAAVQPNGKIAWVEQGLYNVCPQKYYDVYSVRSCCDEYGSPYVAAVVKKYGSRDSVLCWKLDMNSAVSLWNYRVPDGLANYSAYGFALTGGKNAVWQSKPYEFITVNIAALGNKVYLGYTTPDKLPNSALTIQSQNYVGISGFAIRHYAENTSAYGYITTEYGLCRCNDSACGCMV